MVRARGPPLEGGEPSTCPEEPPEPGLEQGVPAASCTRPWESKRKKKLSPSFPLATFQALNGHTWLVATVLESTDLEHSLTAASSTKRLHSTPGETVPGGRCPVCTQGARSRKGRGTCLLLTSGCWAEPPCRRPPLTAHRRGKPMLAAFPTKDLHTTAENPELEHLH